MGHDNHNHAAEGFGTNTNGVGIILVAVSLLIIILFSFDLTKSASHEQNFYKYPATSHDAGHGTEEHGKEAAHSQESAH